MADNFTSAKLKPSEIDSCTSSLRNDMGISDEIAINIIELLEFDLPAIIPEFRLIVKSDTDMLSSEGHFREAFTEFEPPRIFVAESVYDGANEGNTRFRFTLAHELGHLLLHKNYAKGRAHRLSSNAKQAGAYNEDLVLKGRNGERQANLFAAALLAPTNGIIKVGTPKEISEIYKVSLTVAEIRFRETRLKRLYAKKKPHFSKVYEEKKKLGLI